MSKNVEAAKNTALPLTPVGKQRGVAKIDPATARAQDAEMVKGIFRFYEVPGGQLSFVYNAYKDDEVERYDLTDGKIYTIPRGVACHLNKNGRYPVHAFIKDKDGNSIAGVGAKVARFGFQSLEFVDIGEYDNALTTIPVV